MQKIIVPTLFFCGIFSLVLQSVGFISPAWMMINLGVERLPANLRNLQLMFRMHFEISMGLWTSEVCVFTKLGNDCGNIWTANLNEFSNGSPAIDNLLHDWKGLQKLTILAEISAIVGIIELLACAPALEENPQCRCRTVLLLVSWILSAILNLVAVIKTDDQMQALTGRLDELDKMADLKLHRSWAIIISGIGGGFAAFVAFGVALLFLRREKACSVHFPNLLPLPPPLLKIR